MKALKFVIAGISLCAFLSSCSTSDSAQDDDAVFINAADTSATEGSETPPIEPPGSGG